MTAGPECGEINLYNQENMTAELDLTPQLFRTVFEQSPVSTQIFSPDGTTVAVNGAYEQLWGVTLQQIAGYNVLQDQQLVDKGIMPLIRRAFAGEAVSLPAIQYVPDETIPGLSRVPYRWVAASMYPVKDQTGAVREVVLMHQDITEQRHAEDALRQSEERFRAIFDSAPVGISMIDRDGRYIAVNAVRQEMLGLAADQILGRHYLDFTYPEDVSYDLEVNERARADGRDRYQLEKRFVRPDGSARWDRITVRPVLDETGELLYSVSVAEDITERKTVEEERSRLYEIERAMRLRVERLAGEQAAILSQIAEGVIMADPTGRLTFVNDEARRIYGIAELGVMPDEYSRVYHVYTLDGEPYPSLELPMSRAVLHGETSRNVLLRIRRPDGLEVIGQVNAAPVLAEDGTKLGAVLAVRDVTSQFNLEQQKDDFLSAAAHDLRTPLTSMKGRIQLLQRRLSRGTGSPDQMIEDLDKIDAGLTRMSTLISELLDVANLQIGRPLTLNRMETDLVELVREVISDHQHFSDRHHIVLNATASSVRGNWDPTRLERVLANLLSNAVKYSPHGGDITITVDSDGDWAVLSVADRGIGIPMTDLPHVFDRFRRGENAAGKIPGTGIGLAAVRDIVEHHGGSISAANREDGGAIFTIRLPRS